MSKEKNSSDKKKNKWFLIGLKFVIAIFIVYISLFTIRFVQLNFLGKHCLYTTQIPSTLHDGYLTSTVEGHYSPEDWKQIKFTVQFVDLNWDWKTDFVLYARDMIMVVEPADNGKWKPISFADSVGKFLYLPLTVWGNPVVLRLQKFAPDHSWFTTME